MTEFEYNRRHLELLLGFSFKYLCVLVHGLYVLKGWVEFFIVIIFLSVFNCKAFKATQV